LLLLSGWLLLSSGRSWSSRLFRGAARADGLARSLRVLLLVLGVFVRNAVKVQAAHVGEDVAAFYYFLFVRIEWTRSKKVDSNVR
jgi:hypothetical protein